MSEEYLRIRAMRIANAPPGMFEAERRADVSLTRLWHDDPRCTLSPPHFFPEPEFPRDPSYLMLRDQFA